jgi:hypothetical protein
VKQILKEEGVPAEVLEVNVQDQATALALGFLGSPTVRIGGLDVEPAARSFQNYGMTCRTYWDSGKREGLPSRDVIRAAIKEALARGGANECCQAPSNSPIETQRLIRKDCRLPDRNEETGALL